MTSVVTMVTAYIAPDREADVTGPFEDAVRAGMPERRRTALLRGHDGWWCVATLWASRDDLDAYLSSVDEPFARRLLRNAGGTPEVLMFDVVSDSDELFGGPGSAQS